MTHMISVFLYTDNEDYSGLSQQFTFNADNHGFSFTVPIMNDNRTESVEQFIAIVTVNTVQFPGVVLDPSQAVVNISDDESIGILDTNYQLLHIIYSCITRSVAKECQCTFKISLQL